MAGRQRGGSRGTAGTAATRGGTRAARSGRADLERCPERPGIRGSQYQDGGRQSLQSLRGSL
eukprot:4629857-Pyramimonas_sp.AAC.1